jgi:ankyrin repeat protein
LREKWSLAIEHWSNTKRKEEEERKEMKQIKPPSIESDCSCTSSQQSSEDEDISSNDTNIEYTQSAVSVSESCESSALYLEMKYPLHIAVSNDDKDAIKVLITLSPERTLRDERVLLTELQSVVDFPLQTPQNLLNTRLSLLHLAVVLDKSHLLQLLLSSARSSNLNMVTSTFAVDDLDDKKRTPLMLACELGFNDCIRGLLRFGPKVTLRQQGSGDCALHVACRFGGASTVLAVLVSLRGKDDKLNASKDKNSMRHRLICCRNRKNETPLHIACKRGRFDILEALLSSCSSATADKALVAEDYDGHTPLLSAIVSGAVEIVMHLLTWRGNHRENVSLAKGCPLILAVGTKSMEMCQLLIECRSLSTFESYDYTGALLKAIWCFEENEPEAHTFIQILIEEGADPHKKVNFSHSLNEGDCILGKSPLTLAAMQGRVHFVTDMLDTYSTTRWRQINAMHNDPFLRSQSSEYFLSIEAKEREKMRNSCEDTLIKLLIASCDDCELSTWRLGCCLVLFRRNALIDDNAFLRLFQGMRVGHPVRILSSAQVLAPNMAVFEGQYRCTSRTSQSEHSHYSRPILKDWSESLLTLKWMTRCIFKDIVSCSWIKKTLKAIRGDEEESNRRSKDEDSEFCTFVVEGIRLEVHKTILTQKSAKLEAAVRFEEMKRNVEMGSGCAPEILLEIPYRQFYFLVQHCYHGSICCGLSPDLTECCQELLDLYLLAMEYLCPSLALECEMRLLSSNPYKCFCWNCCDRAEATSEPSRRNDLTCHYKVKVC